MRSEAVLSPSELEIMKAAQKDPSIFTDYFFRPPGESKGWLFDDNFVPEGAWQNTVHGAKQRDICVIGGFGTGKTLGVAMSACVWATLMRDFRFLNVAPKIWQAKQMYDLILLWARNTRFEDLIWEKPRKPHPKIIIRFRIGNALYESSLEFMSVDRDATGILSWEGDWLHIDEAGLLDNLEEVIINVGSRLRGHVRGRERLGRFSMTSNSWDNFHLWYFFDQAMADPEHHLSIVVSSRHNKNITEDQLARMVARIPKEERQRFIDGSRPEGKGKFFDRESIYQCEDPLMDEIIAKKIGERTPGWVIERVYGAGVCAFRMPPQPGHYYMLLGDPGVDNAPLRNSPTLMVWDVTEFPNAPASLAAFWWGSGGGKITPWITEMFNLMELYTPIYTGVDSTGPQKNTAVLINEHLFKERFEHEGNEWNEVGYTSPHGIIRGISGLDFSGSGKVQYLIAARLLVEAGLFRWPKMITGFRSQLSNYDLENDKKIAQDLVATLGMSAHAIRTWFHISPEDLLIRSDAEDGGSPLSLGRSPDPRRNRRANREVRPEQQPA